MSTDAKPPDAGTRIDALDGVRWKDGVDRAEVERLIANWCRLLNLRCEHELFVLDRSEPAIRELEAMPRRSAEDDRLLLGLRVEWSAARWRNAEGPLHRDLILAAVLRATSEERQEDQVAILVDVLKWGDAAPARRKDRGGEGTDSDHRQESVRQRIMRAGGWRYVELVSVPALTPSPLLRDRRPPWAMFMLPTGLHVLILAEDARGARWPAGTYTVKPDFAERLFLSYPWAVPRPHPGRSGWAVTMLGDAPKHYPDPDGRTLPRARPPVLAFLPPPL